MSLNAVWWATRSFFRRLRCGTLLPAPIVRRCGRERAPTVPPYLHSCIHVRRTQKFDKERSSHAARAAVAVADWHARADRLLRVSGPAIITQARWQAAAGVLDARSLSKTSIMRHGPTTASRSACLMRPLHMLCSAMELTAHGAHADLTDALALLPKTVGSLQTISCGAHRHSHSMRLHTISQQCILVVCFVAAVFCACTATR